MRVGILKMRALILLLISLSVSSYAIEIKLKLSGSLLFLDQDHINRTVNDWEEWLKRGGLNSIGWIYKQGEIKNLNFGTAFEGEFLISFTPHLAAGLGTGFIYAEQSEDDTSLTLERDSSVAYFVKPIKINVFHTNFSAYYFHSLADKLRMYVRGGVGFVWAKYVEREGTKASVPYFNQEATDHSQSFLSSLGLSYEATSFMQFFIEGEARFLKLNGFKGENNDGESGGLYFFEEYDPGLEFWRAKIGIMSEIPSEPNIRSVEEVVVNLSGFSVKIGFIIKF